MDKRLADGEGFEPPVGIVPTAVFKTAALDHSATHPNDDCDNPRRRCLSFAYPGVKSHNYP